MGSTPDWTFWAVRYEVRVPRQHHKFPGYTWTTTERLTEADARSVFATIAKGSKNTRNPRLIRMDEFLIEETRDGS